MKIALNPELEQNTEAEKSIIERVFYLNKKVTNAKFEFLKNEVYLNLTVSSPLQTTELASLKLTVNGLVNTTFSAHRFVEEKKVFETYNPDSQQNQSILSSLLESKYIVKLGVGRYAYKGLFQQLLNFLDEEFSLLAAAVNAKEESYPTVTNVKPLIDSDYFQNFPHHVMLVAHLDETSDNIDLFSKANSKRLVSDQLDISKAKLASVKEVLNPTICYNCFSSYANEKIPKEGLIITSNGQCHRHEYLNHQGLERLSVFNMREIIFMGDKAFVEQTRQSIIERTKDLVEKLELTATLVSATDPFFTNDSLSKKALQSLHNLKYELQMPLSGSSNQHLAVSSFNLHQRFMGDTYNISVNSDEDFHSGCVGYGLERFAYCFLQQHGLEIDNWPNHAKTKIMEN